METKICGRCHKETEICFFGKDKRSKTGYRSTCNSCRRIESKEYRERNYEKRKETCKKYVENNKHKVNEYSKKWKRNTRKINPIYRIISNVRERTKDYLNYKTYNQNSHISDVIGCSPKFLIEYLEQKFKDGMSWDNYGFYGWHIDHKIPLSSAKTEEEVYKLCHYTNLQPLWAEDNLKKGSKII